MTRDLEGLASRTFDVAIVGGGITGACIAHDAALRGLSVALVERGDFGGATSAASSKLLHGGIRYLQQLQFGKVRESSRERGAFLRIAPHLVRWVPFLIPTTRSITKGRLLLGSGVRLYRALTAGTSPRDVTAELREPEDGFISRDDLLARHPVLASLGAVTGAWVIHEAHMHSSERMSLAFIKSAAMRGAAIANYVEVTRVRQEGSRVTGLEVEDRLSGARFGVAARLVVNAAGPWIGRLNDSVGAARLERQITAFSKGIHLITRPLLDTAAIAVPTRHRNQAVIQRGGRHFFIIPWRGQSLIGTSNVPFAKSPDQVTVDPEDVSAFLGDINDALPGARLSMADVRYAFAGLYPLTEEVVRPEMYQGTGLYQLVDHQASGGIANLISVLGAKYTTARGLAESAVDLVVRKLGAHAAACQTRTTPLVGGDLADVTQFRRAARERYAADLPVDTIDHLVEHYGSELDAVVEAGRQRPGGLTRLAADQPAIEAEVLFALRAEMAMTLDDVIFRRTGLGTIGDPGRPCLEHCASLMGEVLGWSNTRRTVEVEAAATRFQTFRR